MPPKSRYCPGCQRWKQATNRTFYTDRARVSPTNPYGFQSHCKKCRRADSRKYYRNNPEYREARGRYHKAYRQKMKRLEYDTALFEALHESSE